jgi:hypothetical protein
MLKNFFTWSFSAFDESFRHIKKRWIIEQYSQLFNLHKIFTSDLQFHQNRILYKFKLFLEHVSDNYYENYSTRNHLKSLHKIRILKSLLSHSNTHSVHSGTITESRLRSFFWAYCTRKLFIPLLFLMNRVWSTHRGKSKSFWKPFELLVFYAFFLHFSSLNAAFHAFCFVLLCTFW